MPAKRLNQLVQDMSFEEKLLGVGSALMAVSIFLPWYQDIDSFKTGDMFLGITGPMYLSGFTLLMLAGVNLALLLSDGLDFKLPFGLKKTSKFFFTSGLVSFYLLMLTTTIYFHPKFGINITVKESQFGMFLAFIAAALITCGGWLASREKSVRIKEFQEVAQDKPASQDRLIKMPQSHEVRKPKENLRNFQQQQAPKVIEKQPEQIPMDTLAETEYHQPLKDTVPETSAPANENKKYQKYRMDL